MKHNLHKSPLERVPTAEHAPARSTPFPCCIRLHSWLHSWIPSKAVAGLTGVAGGRVLLSPQWMLKPSLGLLCLIPATHPFARSGPFHYTTSRIPVKDFLRCSSSCSPTPPKNRSAPF